MLMALADLDYIMIKATYTQDTTEAGYVGRHIVTYSHSQEKLGLE